MPNLQIMILHNELHEPIQRMLALSLTQALDALHMVSDREDRLPPGDWVRADDGVLGDQLGADVLGRAARLAVELEAVALRGFGEAGLCVDGSEALEEFLVWL